MELAASQAVQNNKRLFQSFARKLSQDDIQSYTAFAQKFAQWLSDSRAYYPEALQEATTPRSLYLAILLILASFLFG
jgi:hypothetical protein